VAPRIPAPLEFDLRQVSGNPDIVIPYWDWTTGRVSGDANWPFTDDLMGPLGDASGLVTSGPFSSSATWRVNIRRAVFRDDNLAQVPDTNVQLRRRPATVSAGFNLPLAATARTGMASTSPYDVAPFNEFPAFLALINGGATDAQINAQVTTWTAASFRKYLEWRLHNGPHTWVGGQDNWPSGATPTFIAGPMSIPAVSVNDPVFWLHHCNIDRLWTTWQQRHPPGAYAPAAGADTGHNLNDEMVHFEAVNAGNFNAPLLSTPADVLDSRGALDIWYTTDLPLITPISPSVDFGDVPANLTTDWPAKFDVRTCRPVKFRITAIGGTNFSIPVGQGDVVADHDHDHDPVRGQRLPRIPRIGDRRRGPGRHRNDRRLHRRYRGLLHRHSRSRIPGRHVPNHHDRHSGASPTRRSDVRARSIRQHERPCRARRYQVRPLALVVAGGRRADAQR
jgi:tyrosinase